MKSKWKEFSGEDKIMLVVRIVLSAVVIVLAALQLCGVLERAVSYAVPLLGVYLLILAVQEWKRNRASAILNVCLALFIFAVTCSVWFLG